MHISGKLSKFATCLLTIFKICNAQIEISTEVSSSYIIRTQPTRFSLSTLESVAHTLSWLEGNPEIFHASLTVVDSYKFTL